MSESSPLLQAVRDEVRSQLAPLLKRIEALEGDRRKYSTSMRRDDSELIEIKQRLNAVEKRISRELDDTKVLPGPPYPFSS